METILTLFFLTQFLKSGSAPYMVAHASDREVRQILDDEFELKRKRNEIERNIECISQQIDRLIYARDKSVARLKDTCDRLDVVRESLR